MELVNASLPNGTHYLDEVSGIITLTLAQCLLTWLSVRLPFPRILARRRS